MPRGKFRKRRYRGKPRKYRQQKLAVATVQKIAREVAKQEDNKHIHWITHRNLFADPAWGSASTSAPRENEKFVCQPNSFNAEILSDIGNLTENQLVGENQANMVTDRTNEYFIKAAETFLAFENNTDHPVRCRVEMVYVPNLNTRTADQQDLLNPTIHTFKSGTNLKYAGMFRKYIRQFGTAQASTPTYQLLAAKEFVLPAAQQYVTPAPPASGVGVAGFHNTKRKYITLKKYFKRPKKLLWKSYVQQQEITGPQLCDNGNIIIQIITDSTTLVPAAEMASANGVKWWGVGGVKYYIRAGLLDVVPTSA